MEDHVVKWLRQREYSQRRDDVSLKPNCREHFLLHHSKHGTKIVENSWLLHGLYVIFPTGEWLLFKNPAT
jgi:hypothetical protein